MIAEAIRCVFFVATIGSSGVSNTSRVVSGCALRDRGRGRSSATLRLGGRSRVLHDRLVDNPVQSCRNWSSTFRLVNGRTMSSPLTFLHLASVHTRADLGRRHAFEAIFEVSAHPYPDVPVSDHVAVK